MQTEDGRLLERLVKLEALQQDRLIERTIKIESTLDVLSAKVRALETRLTYGMALLALLPSVAAIIILLLRKP